MNIEYELQRWGAWAAEVNGLRIKPLMMFNDGTASKSRDQMSDEEGRLFDPVVCALKMKSEEQFDLIRLRYIHGMSFNAIGMVKKLNKAIVFNELNKAQGFIEGYLMGYHRAYDEIMLSSL